MATHVCSQKWDLLAWLHLRPIGCQQPGACKCCEGGSFTAVRGCARRQLLLVRCGGRGCNWGQVLCVVLCDIKVLLQHALQAHLRGILQQGTVAWVLRHVATPEEDPSCGSSNTAKQREKA